MKNIPRRLLALHAALLLAACGGGGNGQPSIASVPAPAPSPSPAPAPGSSPAPAPSSGPDVTDPAAGGTYPAGSQLAMAYATLNAERQRCGFGALAQSGALDAAAGAHASYLAMNNVLGHTEDPTKPGYYGDTLSARLTRAGYNFTSGGEVAASGGGGPTGGTDAIRNLLSAPYHSRGMLDTMRDVGLGIAAYSSTSIALVGDFGVQAGQSPQTHAGVLTYPCAGTANAPFSSGGESPSPIPDVADPHWGQPVLVSGPSTLQVTAASITGPQGAVNLLAVYGDGQTADPNGSFKNGWAAVIPAPLQPNTTYTVNVAWTAAGVPGSAQFTFVTRAN